MQKQSYNKKRRSYGAPHSNRPSFRGEKSFHRSSRSNPYGRGRFINKDMYISKAYASEATSIYESGITFSDFPLAPIILTNIRNKGYVHPTKIQAEIIPQILQNKDVLGLASTGSGKTAAFLIPLIHKVLKNPGQKCLIVAPTRELINQIKNEFATFAKDTNIRDVLILGGASYYEQIRLLKRDPAFVMATPGRLIDLCNQGRVNLASFNNVVLDEVDQMLDMGFINDVKEIISKLKNPRQSMFFSATLSKKTEDIANTLLKNPYKAEVEKQSPAKNVEQNIITVAKDKSKIDVLHNLLVNTEFSRVLVFSKTKQGADDIALELKRRGHKSDSLHGNKSLGQRSKVLSMFKKEEIDILVATDVASRGIDVPDISHVINYDEPATMDDYIHRIGRTGRIGKKGIALTFVRG